MPHAMKLDRTSPSYTESVVKKKSQIDPKETAIREKIAECVLQESWSKEAFETIRTTQKKYLEDMVSHADDEEYVHQRTQSALKELSSLTRCQVEEGSEYLEAIPRGTPVLLMTNHFGAYKLTGLRPKEDLGVDIPDYDAIYPYPMYFASLYPVAQKLGDGLYYSSEDFPLVFGKIHSNAGFIHVPPAAIQVEGGRTAYLVEQTRNALRRHPHSAITNFPEGGTSGKYSGLSPYDLDQFKTGGYVIAAQLGLHVVTVGQYFDPKEGFRLKVFEPFVPELAEKAEFESMAERDRARMQAWLDQKRGV